ncbi:FAD:protein FMN transferase [Megamonas hypermegale]|nr:FAD:protein FMN transferase [Megamonas hypermegale]
MDTQISFIVYGNNAETALQLAKVRIMQLEDLLSVTDKCSDVYAINHSEGKLIKISNDTSNIIQFALNMAKDTDGALDPTIYPLLKVWGFTTDNYKIPDEKSIAELLPYIDYKKVKLINNTIILPKGMELDLGAVAKGYTSDEVIKLWRSQGISSALINLGGNVQTLGVKPDGSLWKIGIKAPQGAGNLGVLQIGETAVITSGSYERYFIGEDGKKYWHILNPVTGKPAQSGFKSVTIVGDSGKQCDALSTAIFVMGKPKAVDYWQAKRNFEMILVTQENEIWITEGIVNAFTLQPEYADLTVRVIK